MNLTIFRVKGNPKDAQKNVHYQPGRSRAADVARADSQRQDQCQQVKNLKIGNNILWMSYAAVAGRL